MRVGECTNDRDLIQALDQLKTERQNNRRPFEVTWWNNIALVAGDHFAEFVPETGNFVEPTKEPHQVRLVVNQARIVARQQVSKITKARPVMDVMPRSGDDDDLAATKVGLWALDAAEFKYKLRKRRRQALWWTILCGTSGVMVGWNPEDDADGYIEFAVDPTTGDRTYHPERISELKKMVDTGEIDDEKVLELQSWPLGDLEYKVYSPFQLLPDDTVLEWEDIGDLITIDVMELEKAKDIWPEAANDMTADDARPSSVMQKLLLKAGFRTDQQETSAETLNIFTWWLKPGQYGSEYLKYGKMVRWCNKETKLEIHEHCPYNDGLLPFAFFTHTPNATSIWSDTVITDVRPINLELDKTVSQLLENRDYMVNPQWRVPNQAQINKIKSQPGGMVKYQHQRDVPPPEQLPGIPLPTQIENLVVGLRDMILDVSGMGEVSRGRVPSGVRAQNMLAFLQEEDESTIAPISEDFEDSIARMATLTLSRFSQFYTVDRMLKAYRPGGRADVRKFKGANLKGQTDVVVQSGSALPKLKSSKQAYVIQLVQMGILKDPKQIRDYLELGEGEPDEVDMAYLQADRENDIMMRSVRNQLKKGEEALYAKPPEPEPEPDEMGMMPTPEMEPEGLPTGAGQAPEMGLTTDSEEGSSFAVPVKQWHLHEAHLQRHRRIMMSAEFEALALTYPDVVRLFDEHTTMHEQALQQEMMQQMQMMALAQGGPSSTAPPQGAQPQADTAAAAQAGGY